MTLRSLPLLGLTLITAGCSGRAAVPDTPDLAALRAEYEHPNAELDETSVREMLETAPDVQTFLAGLSSLELASTGVNEASASAGQKSGAGINLQGSIEIEARCPGDFDDPVYDASRNGSIGLTLAVENTRILRGIYGHASNCVARRTYFDTTVRVSLDGPFSIDLGGDIDLRQPTLRRLLFALGGEITIGDTSFTGVSGRITGDSVESLFTLPDDSTVVLLVLAAGVIGVRDQEGTWACDAVNFECSRN
ncbi:MAG TPA: hypothetical protein VGK73_19285 [Polyangiaceae bacterium]